MRLPNRDIWIGAVILFVALAFWLEADKIRISPLDGPVNAAGLPKALAYALGGLALALMLQSIAAAVIGGSQAAPGDRKSSIYEWLHPHLRAAGMLAIGVGYLLVVTWIGYAAAIVALIVTVSLYNGARPGGRMAAIALGGGVCYHLFFVEFLGIPQPPGLLIGPFLG